MRPKIVRQPLHHLPLRYIRDGVRTRELLHPPRHGGAGGLHGVRSRTGDRRSASHRAVHMTLIAGVMVGRPPSPLQIDQTNEPAISGSARLGRLKSPRATRRGIGAESSRARSGSHESPTRMAPRSSQLQPASRKALPGRAREKQGEAVDVAPTIGQLALVLPILFESGTTHDRNCSTSNTRQSRYVPLVSRPSHQRRVVRGLVAHPRRG